MNPPEFLKELNQGAEKAFGENAQNMIDNLLSAKLPPKLKRSVNMAQLENSSYDEIVAHHKRGNWSLTPLRNRTTCERRQCLPQHLSLIAFSPLGCSLISSSTFARKKVT